ncbi:MAG TPA: ureidoglycolate lyase [Sphingomicrobium sp.]|nr:ureidoglycolate lyase [Sphingomicrobium sp.]
MARIQVPIHSLTREAFRPYGDVIQVAESRHYTINQGLAERYADMAALDLLEGGGQPTVGIVRAEPRPLPLKVKLMERHPKSSQLFIPLAPRPFLVLVAAASEQLRPESIVAFRTLAGQGINYRRGVWHHPLIALDQSTDFLVVDRHAKDENCDEASLEQADLWVASC